MHEDKPFQPIREFRKARGLTIQACADAFDVDKKTVIRWERGEPPIPLKRLDDAMRILDVKRHELRPDIVEDFAR